MLRKPFSIAVLVGVLSGAAALPAQQAQSAAPGQAMPPEVKEFQGYEDQWSLAQVHADQYALENLLSPLFVNISSTGEVTTRNQDIVQLLDKTDQLISMEQRAVSVRTFGDTAVVSGTYVMKWSKEGKTREERGIFTHVYERMRDRWQCVNSQRTAVVEVAPPGKKERAARKKSDADEPFRIPFLYKGKQSTQPNAPQNANIPPN